MDKFIILILLAAGLVFVSGCSDDGDSVTEPGPEEEILIESGTYANNNWIAIEDDNRHGSKIYLVSNGTTIEKQVRYFHRERITSEWEYDSTRTVGTATMDFYRGFCITEGLELLSGYVVQVSDDYQYLYLIAAERYSGSWNELTGGEWTNTEMYNYDVENFPDGTQAVVLRFNTDLSGYFGIKLADDSVMKTNFTYTKDNNFVYLTLGEEAPVRLQYAIRNNTLYFSTGSGVQYLKVND